MTAYQSIKKILILTSILSVSFCYCAEPKKLFYFMGGGGEPEGETTIFDGDLNMVSKFIQKSDWETTVSFNGGHKKSEEILQKKFSKSRNVGSFTEKNYKFLIEEMIRKIRSGELKAGDQLMVNFSTHGARNSGEEKTHRIALAHGAATNLQDLMGAKTVNLDLLETLSSEAAKAGVKLAIVDVSCFSGNTLKIKNDKTCVISASGTDHYGYAGRPINFFFGDFTYTFGADFFDSLKKGKNLEDIYLRSRISGSAPDFPMISTAEGEAVNEMLYKLITPYLKYNDKDTTDFSKLYPNTSQSFEERSCTMKNNFTQMQNLIGQLDDLRIVIDGYNNDISEFKQLKYALDEYRNYQLKYEDSYRSSLEAEKEIKGMLDSKFSDSKKIWGDYNPMSFLTLDVDWALNYWSKVYDENVAKKASSSYQSYLKEMVDALKTKKEISKYVKENLSEDSKKKMRAHEEFVAKSGVTQSLAVNVSAAAKKVYDTLYRAKRDYTKSNPCRDFVL